MKTNSLHKKCLLCGSSTLQPLSGYEAAGLVKCKDCTFVFSNKVPSEEELRSYYNESYSLTRYFSSITKSRYLELLEMFEPYRKTNKILDIGCGNGYFLEVAKEKGWDVYGIEVSSDASRKCEEKGITVFQGGIAEADFEQGMFDVIVSIEVIEHVNTPKAFLTQSNKFLRKGGAMYVTTPNFNSYLRYRLKEKYDVIDYPNHLCYFTSKTLRKAFEDNGFKPKSIKTTGMSITRIKTSKGKSNQEYISETSDDEMLRYKIERNAFLRVGKKAMNSLLSSLKIGLNIKGFFIKPE